MRSIAIASLVTTAILATASIIFSTGQESTLGEPSSTVSPLKLENVTVDVQRTINTTRDWVFTENADSPASAPRLDNCADPQRIEWLKYSGAVEYEKNQVTVAISATEEGSLLVKSLQLVHYRRTPPISGSKLRLCGGAGPQPEAYLITLEGDRPKIHLQTKEVPEEDGYFEIAAGATKYFYIEAVAIEGAYEWAAELTILSGKESRVVEIGQPEAPLTVTS